MAISSSSTSVTSESVTSDNPNLIKVPSKDTIVSKGSAIVGRNLSIDLPRLSKTQKQMLGIGIVAAAAIALVGVFFHTDISNLAKEHTFAFTSVTTGLGLLACVGLYCLAKKNDDADILDGISIPRVKNWQNILKKAAIVASVALIFTACYFSSDMQNFLQHNPLFTSLGGAGVGLAAGGMAYYGLFYQHKKIHEIHEVFEDYDVGPRDLSASHRSYSHLGRIDHHEHDDTPHIDSSHSVEPVKDGSTPPYHIPTRKSNPNTFSSGSIGDEEGETPPSRSYAENLDGNEGFSARSFDEEQ